jgi:hypothetical protein
MITNQLIIKGERERMLYPLSHSKIQRFKSCPAQFKRMYELRIPHATVPMWVGNVVHEILHHVVLTMLREKRCLEEILTVIEEAYKSHELWSNLKFYFRQIRNSIVFQQTLVEVLDTSASVGMEEKIAFNFQGKVTDFDAEDAYFRGVLDLSCILNGTPYILDYKSGFGKTDYIENEQLDRYALLFLTKHPEFSEIKVKVWKLNEDAIYAKSKTTADVQNTFIKLREVEQEMLNSSFPERPARFADCFSCPVTKTCAVYSAATHCYGVTEVSDDTVPELLKAMLLHQQEYKRMADLLKIYFEKTGKHLSIDGKKYGFVPEDDWEVDVTDVRLFTEKALSLGFSKDYIWKQLSPTSAIKNMVKKQVPRTEWGAMFSHKLKAKIILAGKEDKEGAD